MATHLNARCLLSSWDRTYPLRGNAYRALSCFLGAPLDDVLKKAAEELLLDPEAVKDTLPKDFVVWVDPGSVAYRVGDYGTIVSLMEGGKLVTATHTTTTTITNTSRAVTISPPTPTPSPFSPATTIQPSSVPFNQNGLLTAAGYFANQSNQFTNTNPNAATASSAAASASSVLTKSSNGAWQYQHHQQYQESQRISMNVFASNTVFSPAPVVAVRISSPPASPRQQPTTKRPAYVMAN